MSAPTGVSIAEPSVDLRRNSLSFPATLAQSIANIAPTVTPAMSIPLVVANAGNGTWFIYLVATFGLLLVGLNVSSFARRFASAGSLYTYTAKGLGRTAGFLSGWAMLVAYLFTAMATLLAFSIFGNNFLAGLGTHAPTLLWEFVGALLIFFLAYRDIRFSSLLAMGLELVSVFLIASLGVVLLFKTGFHIDLSQLSLKGANISGLQLAMVLAVFSFVGFESSATLGQESRNPFKAIPRAVIFSTLAVGLFFAAMAYIEVSAFNGGAASLAKSGAPLNDLATAFHLGIFGELINFGATVSFFSCSLASVNAAARVKFAMGRDNLLPKIMGRVHAKNRTPHVAVFIASVLNFAVPALLSGINTTDAYGYLGTVATYGFLFVYILISVASMVYLYKARALRFGNILLGFGAIAFMSLPVLGSFYPVPDAPYSWMPYAFLAYLIVGVFGMKVSLRRRATKEEALVTFDANNQAG